MEELEGLRKVIIERLHKLIAVEGSKDNLLVVASMIDKLSNLLFMTYRVEKDATTK